MLASQKYTVYLTEFGGLGDGGDGVRDASKGAERLYG